MYRLCLLVAFPVLSSCATAGEDDTPDAALALDAPAAIDAPMAIDGAPAFDATPIDAMPMAQSVRHEQPGDFIGPGAVEGGAGGARMANLAPFGYFYGGLLAGASDTGIFLDPAATDWADIEAMTATASRSVTRTADVNWGTATPIGLGLANGENWTQWWRGEVYLDAGDTRFYLLADDHAFLDVAPPNTQDFTRVVAATWPSEINNSYTATEAGWHPIRVALCDQTLDALLRVRYGPGGGGAQDLPPERLRFRADTVQGFLMTGWDDIFAVGATGQRLDESTPANQSWSTSLPPDLGIVGTDTYTVRWTGQYYVQTAGSYSFRLVTDDGQRLWIDGVRYLNSWDTTTHDNTTPSLSLGIGWHDFVVDVAENAVNASAALTIASGPEGVGAPLPLMRTRPARARAMRHTSGVNRTDFAIPDSGQVEIPIVLTAAPDAQVTGIDLTWIFSHTYWGDLEMRLISPGGNIAILRDNVGGSTSGTTTDRIFTNALDGIAAAGTWTLRVNDTAGLDTGTLQDFQLTVHYTGGTAPVPVSSFYESPLIDLGGNALTLDALQWSESLPSGTDVQLRIRTGVDEPDTLAADWSAPVSDPTGSPLAIAAGQFAQYRVEFTSDGVQEPSVAWVQLDYSGF